MKKTWFLDFDGTLVLQKSYLSEEDTILQSTFDLFEAIKNDYIVITTARPQEHKKRIIDFMKKYNLKFDEIICGLPTGPRVLINDKKNDGMKTAYSFNLERDRGIDIKELSNIL